ncbi:MAG: mevalonate kinase [Nitrososphaerota archaeon]|nr:mevalonate kinase [Nitrososphaerota archaeon]MDG6945067.1 mevalonate kinase [Nitrososphaerota archaeon]MDG6955153.1 mevalonate kinase [Nitrososphaerota archaeon]MDG6958318.1 mevalonate kinase [Nitrososphaerota archaeon]MDG6972909.1 mevalonate kinase [Nitrososphaerota archaeon]
MRAVAEAPSKAIVTGEHFVVHGAWALAAALPKKVRVEVEGARSFRVTSQGSEEGPAGIAPVRQVVRAVAEEYSVGQEVAVSVTSSVPRGAGLGSSAATMVALSAALSEFHSLGLGAEDIIRLSMVGENAIHGRPSGIDPAVCALGGAILFKPGTKPKEVSLGGSRSLLVSYSGISRDTKAQIGRVSEAKDRYPGYFARLAGSVGALSLEAAGLLAKGDGEGLGGLLTMNHALLGMLGVSNPTLDGMVDQMITAGAYGAKLTGGGGGGSVIAVAPKAKEKNLVSGLTARGFETFIAKVPTEGVKSWLER